MGNNAMMLASIMGPVYLALALSLLLYAGQWQKLYGKWGKDHFLLFPLMFMMGILGIISVQVYNVWAWDVWLLVTLTGWAMILKSLFYLLLPGSVMKYFMKWGSKCISLLYVGGVLVLAMGAVLTYYSYFA